MAYGNNRAGKQPRAHFRKAGGAVVKFRHPYFAGMIVEGNGGIDEIDVSESMKLEGRFFEANYNQDSAKQVVLIDGSTVTITNKMLNGTITIPAVPTTGDLAGGDFIAGCQLIQSVGDTVGGIITKTDFVNGKALTKVYYGVTVQRCPTDVSEGNDVAVYNVQLLYSGWIQAESSSGDINKKAIWAVGAQKGIEGFYSPYKIQNGITEAKPLVATDLSPTDGTAINDNIGEGGDNSDQINALKKEDSGWDSVVDISSEVNNTDPPTDGTSTNPTGSSGNTPSNP